MLFPRTEEEVREAIRIIQQEKNDRIAIRYAERMAKEWLNQQRMERGRIADRRTTLNRYAKYVTAAGATGAVIHQLVKSLTSEYNIMSRPGKRPRLHSDEETKEMEVDVNGNSQERFDHEMDNVVGHPLSNTPRMTNSDERAQSGRSDAARGHNRGDGDEPMALAAAGPAGAGKVSKETPISLATPSYGLQETHTTVLPMKIWFSVIPAQLAVGEPAYKGTKVELRMNSIFDIMMTTLAANIAGKGPADPGVYITGAVAQSTGTTITTSYPFPSALTQPNTVEGPWWRAYWTALYEYYSVLGCDWKINMQNTSLGSIGGGLLAYEYDGYTTAGGNKLPDVTLTQAYGQKGIQWKKIPTMCSE